jgi:hypothetical protein
MKPLRHQTGACERFCWEECQANTKYFIRDDVHSETTVISTNSKMQQKNEPARNFIFLVSDTFLFVDACHHHPLFRSIPTVCKTPLNTPTTTAALRFAAASPPQSPPELLAHTVPVLLSVPAPSRPIESSSVTAAGQTSLSEAPLLLLPLLVLALRWAMLVGPWSGCCR